MVKSEIRAAQLQGRGTPRIATTRSWKRQGRTPPQIAEGSWLCRPLDFGPAASGLRQYISVVLSHPKLFRQPEEMNAEAARLISGEASNKSGCGV